MSVAKAEIRRVLKVCRQVQDQLNKSTFALKGEGGSADFTEVNNAISDLTTRIENLEISCAEVTGIEQLKSGLRVGQWQSVDAEGKNLNGDSDEVTSGDYIGIKQLTSGNYFGTWQQVA